MIPFSSQEASFVIVAFQAIRCILKMKKLSCFCLYLQSLKTFKRARKRIFKDSKKSVLFAKGNPVESLRENVFLLNLKSLKVLFLLFLGSSMRKFGEKTLLFFK